MNRGFAAHSHRMSSGDASTRLAAARPPCAVVIVLTLFEVASYTLSTVAATLYALPLVEFSRATESGDLE